MLDAFVIELRKMGSSSKIFANGGQSPVFAMNLATFAIWESRADVRMSKAIRAGLEELVFFRTLRANPSLVVS